MGSSIEDQTAEPSPPAEAVAGDPSSRILIVPSEDGSSGSLSVAADPAPGGAFLGDQHETVISRRSSANGASGALPPALLKRASSSGEMGALLEGCELGHFRLERFVGGGGMGAVFRAVDCSLGRTVAVKVLSRDRTDEDTLRRFQNEAQSAARLDHENIARVYYVGEDRGLHFIVFEFIEGVNVRDLVLQKGPLPLEEAISYVLQVAEALEHASLRNVIHRDIKPSNVLVTAERRAKLVDMGLARLHQMDSDADDLTASGVTLGTFDYISPEQARDPRTADVRSDLYSLGCTFYYMLTGRPPFPDGTVLQKLLSHSSDEPPDPRLFRPDLDEQMVQVLERLLAKQPGRRFQRPSELIGQLLLVAERLNMQTIARDGTVWAAPQRTLFASLERLLPWGIPATIFLMMAAILFALGTSSEPFEFAETPISLQPSGPPNPPLEERPADPPAAGPTQDPPASHPSLPPQEPPATAVPGGADAAAGFPPDALQQPGAAAPVANGDADPAGAQPPAAVGTGPPAADPSAAAFGGGTPQAADSPSALAGSTSPATPPAQGAPASAAGAVTPAGSAAGPPGAVESAPAEVSPALIETLPGAVPESPGNGSPAARSGSPIPDSGAPAAVPTASPSARSALASPLPPAAGQAARPARIVVGDLSAAWPGGTLAVATLAEACRAAQQSGVTRIELHLDGPREELPLEIGPGELAIAAGAGYQPQVVFRPTGDEANSDPAMIHCSGSRLTWQGVHLLLDLSAASAQNWSLFRLRPYASVDVRESILTIRNVDSQRQKRLEHVQFFGLAPRSPAAGNTVAQLPHNVSLSDTILRGQADVIQADQATAFRLLAQNSLLVARGWLVDLEGSETKPSLQEGRVDVVLKSVTAVLHDGLCRMGSDPQAPYQVDLHTEFSDNILYITRSAAPLFERTGVSRLADVERRLDLRGRDNFYPGSTRVLRLRPDARSDEMIDYDFDDRDRLPFLEEKSPGFMLMWQGLPAAERTEDQHTAEDYELDESEFNPGVVWGGAEMAGADVRRLPRLQPVTASAAAAAAPLPTPLGRGV